jgi:hypothetical protein
MRVGEVVVAGILAGREHAAHRVTFIDSPCHHQHIRTWQRAGAAAARRAARLGRQSLGPWNIGVSRQAGRRAEGHELQASGGLGVEVDDFALEILSRCRLLSRLCKCKGRVGRRLRNRIVAKISLNPLAIYFHDAPFGHDAG